MTSQKKLFDEAAILRGKKTFTLREVKKLLAKARRAEGMGLDIGRNCTAIVYDFPGTKPVYLPPLRQDSYTIYSNEKGYEKRVDTFISKYGADASFDIFHSTTPSIEREEGDDEEQVESSNDEQNKDSESCSDGSGNDQPECASRGSEDVSYPKSWMPSEGKWEISLGDGKGGARDIELPAVSQATPKSKDFEGKNSGVGSPLDTKSNAENVSANCDAGKGLDEGQTQTLKTGFPCGESAPMTVSLDKSSSEQDRQHLWMDGGYKAGPLGDVSSPLNSLSFDSFALKGAKGQRAWGLSNPSIRPTLQSTMKKLKMLDKPLTAYSDMRDMDLSLQDTRIQPPETSQFSKESKFRDGNPGGYIDKNRATLGKAQVKAKARKIKQYFEGFFRSNEVGIGDEETPRVSSKKLAKELVSKSVRMARTKKEEKGSGLKLILVDISPSCEAIRDACYAAALAIADEDPDVVVMAHFNGYTAYEECQMVGRRQDEVPLIVGSDDFEPFGQWLKSGKVSGAICFGDRDAEEVYNLLACHCPMVWLSPDTEEQCMSYLKYMETLHERHFDEAQVFIIGGVYDAASAVEGFKKLKKGK